MNKNNRTIGIIGGMGPQASAKLLEVIIAMASTNYGAKNDLDFPEIVLSSVPVPNFISNKKNISRVSCLLKTRIKTLESFNPLCFGIACNTAHILIDELQAETAIPFISIIEEVGKRVARAKIKKVGLLGTPTTIKSGLYQTVLEKYGIKTIIPSAKNRLIVEDVIRSILAGKINDLDRQRVTFIAESLRIQGAEGIILGCTELPLIFPKEFSIPVFDSIEILATALLRKYYK
ncbi:MAG: aspartate/glutamate racemase family protein [Candidatus Levyibacteriota bacterium]